MWDSALQGSTQRVTDALLHKRVLPEGAQAFEKVSGAIAVRTALRVAAGDQGLLFVVPEATASTARHIVASLLIGDYGHANGQDEMPDYEVRRLLKGDILLVTQAISESKAQLDELHIGRGGLRIADIWEVTTLSQYTAARSTKPRVFLTNPGWLEKVAPGRRFGAAVIDASHPRTFEQLEHLLRVASGCTSLRIGVAPPPATTVLSACGHPARLSVWFWDPQAQREAEAAVEAQDSRPHGTGDRFLWACEGDVGAATALAELYRCLLDAAAAAQGRAYPGLQQCWGIYNRLRAVCVALVELEQAASATWAGTLRQRIQELDAVSGHGSVAWDTTWPQLLAATQAAYNALLERKETAKFWAVVENLMAFLASPAKRLRIVVASEPEVALLTSALETLVDGLAQALEGGRVEVVSSAKEAQRVATGQPCPTVLLAPRTNGHRYLDVYSSSRVDEFLYPYEVDYERRAQDRLHGAWEALQSDEGRIRFLQPLGLKPIGPPKPRAAGGRPKVMVRSSAGGPVSLMSPAPVSADLDLDSLLNSPGGSMFDTPSRTSYTGTAAAGATSEVLFTNGERRYFYGNERVDVFHSATGEVCRYLPADLHPAWLVISFVDGKYDSLFQRLTDMLEARLPQKERFKRELWRVSKKQLAVQYPNKHELHQRLVARGLSSGYDTLVSWLDDDPGATIAPQQYGEFKVLASEIEAYAKSPQLLDATFATVQHERGRNRAVGRLLSALLRAVVSGEGYEKAIASARSFDADMADVFAAVEVLTVASVKLVSRSVHG